MQIAAFVRFPPRQKPAAFNLDAMLRQIQDAAGRANHERAIGSPRCLARRLESSLGGSAAPRTWDARSLSAAIRTALTAHRAGRAGSWHAHCPGPGDVVPAGGRFATVR